MYDKLIIAIPHSTRKFDIKSWDKPDVVLRDSDEWTDWYTDIIFEPSFDHPNISTVIGKVSRFDCDLERLIDDHLCKEGRGIIYTKSHSGAVRMLDDSVVASLMTKYYDYRDNIMNVIYSGNNHNLILDCHSFPSYISDYDICIGHNEDGSRPHSTAISMVTQYFKDLGYNVGINDPYANSITPSHPTSHPCKKECGYHSLMIELNKRLYLERLDSTPDLSTDVFETYKPFELKKSSYKLHYAINQLYKLLLAS